MSTTSESGAASRRKGKRGETEVAKTLAALLGDQTIRRNLQQHQDAGQGDLVGDSLELFHVEIKRRAAPFELRVQLWQRQAQIALEETESPKLPVIVARHDKGDWTAHIALSLADLAVFIRAHAAYAKSQPEPE